MARYTYTVPVKPHAKERPRFVKATGVAYTPKRTREAEKAISEAFRDAQGSDPMFTGPIRVTIGLGRESFDITIADADDYQSRNLRGDIDNYQKSILDALNGIAFEDDRQIVEITVTKY